jgi:hypothetical protein
VPDEFPDPQVATRCTSSTFAGQPLISMFITRAMLAGFLPHPLTPL